MFNIIKKEVDFGGKILTFETGKIARQANSVICTIGKTVIMSNVVIANKASDYQGFMPLSVSFLEKYYAAGKIPGGFLKREAKPSDSSVLISRLIDRPIRPLFKDGFNNEVTITTTILSHDPEIAYDAIAIIASSAALAISGAPIDTIIAASKVGYIDNKFILNPTKEELSESDLELIVAGSSDSVLMVESEAKELTEEKMLEAVKFGHENFQKVIDTIKELKDEVNNQEIDIEAKDYADISSKISDKFKDELSDAYKLVIKKERYNKLEDIRDRIIKFVAEEINSQDDDNDIIEAEILYIINQIEKEIVRNSILNNKKRIDGRDLSQVREIKAEVGILPNAHGSALFTRGETQSLVVATIGSSRDEQLIDGLNKLIEKEKFMLHYNFPPYCVGETGMSKGPGRREIGHGKLAWRAINPVLNLGDKSRHSVRIVSEITESNGSSSMATVCGSSLALMDTGLDFNKAVSGIAMGLIKEGEDYVILSDIMGDEDHLGDMDFKVAGTENGITSLQMDIKISGINYSIMSDALKQAKEGRAGILTEMNKAISEPRPDLNPDIDRIRTFTVDKNKIKVIIGKGGQTIKSICEEAGVIIDVSDDGVVSIISKDNDANYKAQEIIEDIITEHQVGDICKGKVIKIIDSGAFVRLSRNKDGFLHISELADHRVEYVEDIISEDDEVYVKIIAVDKRFKLKLSYRSVDQNSGEDISDQIVNKTQGKSKSNYNNQKNENPVTKRKRFF